MIEREKEAEKIQKEQELVIINPPLFSDEGKLSLGQAMSVVMVDILHRYHRIESDNIEYASRSFNVQGKPIEAKVPFDGDLKPFLNGARETVHSLVSKMSEEKAQLGILDNDREFLDSSPTSQRIVQKRFVDLVNSGYTIRKKRSFFLDVENILEEKNLISMIEKVNFRPSSIERVIAQLTTDSRKPVELTKERLFATPLPFYICTSCDENFIPPEVDYPYDPRQADCTCSNCGNETRNLPTDTIAPLFDLTQQKEYLSDSGDKHIIQVCGRNVLTKYIYFSLLVNGAIDEKAPFDDLVVHGSLLDEKGKRMTKWNNNMIYMSELLDEYHPDAIRYALAKSVTTKNTSAKFDSRSLKRGQKLVYKIGNLGRFFESRKFEWQNLQPDENILTDYVKLMNRESINSSLSLAEKYLVNLSAEIKRGHDSNEKFDLIENGRRFRAATTMLEPFLPTIVESLSTHK